MKKRNPRTELASALRESEAKYRQVVERANDGIVIARRGKLVFSNKGFARMSGYPVEELDGIEFLKLVPPERRAEIADRVKRRLAGEDVPATYEIDLVRKDGTVFSVEVNAGVIEYQGEPGDLIILRDITERKQTENQSRRQTAILSTLLNSPQETVALLDTNGTVLNINLNGAIKFGMSPEEMVGKNIYELIPEPVSSERKRIIAEAMRTGQPAHFEDQRQNLHLMNSVYPVNDPQSGELLGAAIFAVDITERTRAEETLRESEERYRTLFENAQVGIYRTTPDGRVLAANPALIQMLGYSSPDELAARNLEQAGFEPDYPRSRFKELIERQGEVRGMEGAWKKRDGSVVWVRENARAVRRVDGAILYYEGTAEDITERKQAEVRLRKLNRAYAMLSDVNQAIVRLREPPALLDKVCQIAVQVGGLRMAWIGLVDESSQPLQVVAQAGGAEAYFEQAGVALRDALVDDCPIQNALRGGQRVICNVIGRDALCLKIAFELGVRSSAAFPLIVSGQIRGAVNFYSGEPDFFDEEEIKLLDELAMDISFAMEFAEQEAERKQAEESLRESEEKFRLLAETSPFGIYAYREKFVYVNPAFEPLTGYTVAELLGMNFWELVHPDSRDLVRQRGAARLQGEKVPDHYEIKLVRKDGDERWIDAAATVVQLGGEPTGIGILADITESKRAEEEIASLAKFPSENPNPVLRIQRDGTLLYANEASDALLRGWQLEIGKPAPSVLQEAVSDALTRQIGITLDTQHDQRIISFFVAPVVKAGYANLYGRDVTERRRAEEALRESKERIRVTLTSIGDGVIATDSEGRVELLNPVAESLTGWKNEEAHGKPLEEIFCIVNEETRRPAENPVVRVLREGLVVGLANHTLLIAQDGTERPIADSGAPIRDKQGQITGVVLVFRDQTEERAAQRALRESEEMFRNLAENAHDGIVIATGQGVHQYANERAAEITGYSVAELLTITMKDLAPPDEIVKLAERLRKRLAGEPVESQYETVIVRKVGQTVPIEVTGAATVWRGQPATIVIIRDITERKRAEAALQEAEARYRALVEQIPAIAYTDSAEQIGQTLYISPQLKTMVGYDPEAWIADNDLWLKIMQPEDRERVSAEYTRSNETGEPFNTEYRVVTPDRRMIWIRDEAILKRDPSGHPLFWQGIMLDITERQRAEAQLADQLDELRRWHAVTLGRETRVLDLKREVNELLARAGQPPRYPSAETEKA